jgi:hypothetical protein
MAGHVVAVTGRIFVDKGLVHGNPDPWTFRNRKIPINDLGDTVEQVLRPLHMEIVEGFLDVYITRRSIDLNVDGRAKWAARKSCPSRSLVPVIVSALTGRGCRPSAIRLRVPRRPALQDHRYRESIPL